MRPAERVVEGRGARVRARRLRREGAVLRSRSAGPSSRDVVAALAGPRARLRHGPRRARRSGPARRSSCSSRRTRARCPTSRCTRTTCSRSSTRRGRPGSPRARRSPTARRWRTCRTWRAWARSRPRRARRSGRRPGCRPRTCSSCRCSTSPARSRRWCPGYASGGKLVLMPPGKFDPDEAMAVIEREQVTNIGGVPTVMWRIVEAESFGRYDLSSVSRIGYGGAPAAPELVERIRAAFPQVRDTLSTAYGLTETASIATSNAGEGYLSHPSSVGRAAPTVEIQIIDPDGSPVPLGRERRDRAARPDDHEPRLLEPARRDRGGDAARRMVPQRRHRLPRRGRLPVPGRPGQGHDHPRRRERVLRRDRARARRAPRHPRRGRRRRSAQAARRRGEGGRAAPRAARPRPPRTCAPYCAERLAGFKVPEYVELRDEPLPRNPAGKVLKSVLRGDGASSAFTPSVADDSAL